MFLETWTMAIEFYALRRAYKYISKVKDNVRKSPLQSVSQMKQKKIPFIHLGPRPPQMVCKMAYWKIFECARRAEEQDKNMCMEPYGKPFTQYSNQSKTKRKGKKE